MGGISSPLLFGRGEATWRAQPTKIFWETNYLKLDLINL